MYQYENLIDQHILSTKLNFVSNNLPKTYNSGLGRAWSQQTNHW